MSAVEVEPPTLPGEVWRGPSLPGALRCALCAVTVQERPEPWWHSEPQGKWVRVEYADSLGLGASIMGAWALTERARAERAMSRFEAMRDHRDAIRILNNVPSHMRGPAYAEVDAKLRDAFERLRALGVEP